MGSHVADETSAGLTFTVDTSWGRVLACVPHPLLAQCFGAGSSDADMLEAFDNHIDLLRKAALVRLEAAFTHEVVLEEIDVAEALKRSVKRCQRP